MIENALLAEQSVLGAMLISDDAVAQVIEILRPDDFSSPGHRKLFRCMVRLSEKNQPVDAVSLVNELTKTNELDEVGGRIPIIELADNAATATNAEYHAHIVRDHSIRRQLREFGRRTATNAEDESNETSAMLDEAEKSLCQLAERHTQDGFRPVSDIIGDVIEDAERLHKGSSKCIGTPSGFIDLDRLICGLEPGTTYIIAGRPAMGKTSFAMNIAENVAQAGIPVGVFSLEMSARQLMMRAICSVAKIDLKKFRSGHCSPSEFERAIQIGSKIHDWPLHIDDISDPRPREIRARARRLKRRHKIGLFILDYVQLVRDHSIKNREQEVAAASAALKSMAKELNTPVIILSQLNRAGESGATTRRPRLSDLRESGAIEQDADVVMFIYRPEHYKPGDKPGLAEVIVEKQRNGPTDTIRLTFLKEFVRFENFREGADNVGD